LGAGHPAGAADVFDDDLLAKNVAQPVRDDAADNVGGTACRERHDHGNRPARPLVGLGNPQSCEPDGGEQARHYYGEQAGEQQ
jgi:hypothetical protein